MNSNAYAYSFGKKQLSNYSYNYSQILNSYIIFLIIFGMFLNNILAFLKYGPTISDRIIVFFIIITFFIVIYYRRIQHFNLYRIFYDFLLSILLVFITYIYCNYPLNSTFKNRPSLFIILIICAIICDIFINKKIIINRYLILILLFSITILLNIIMNGITSENYSIYKINSFLIYTIIPCFFVSMATDKKIIDILKSFIIYFIILSILFSFINLRYDTYKVLEIFVGNYISTGIAYGICFLYVLFDFKCKNILYKILKFGILSIFIFLIINTGARGPTISLLFTIFISCLFYFFKNKIRIIYLFMFLLSMIIFFLSINLINSDNFLITRYEGIDRLMNSYQNIKMLNFDELSKDRLYLYKNAYKNFLEKPFFGKGIGNNTYGGMYPHNSFMEIAAEVGIVGFVPFIVLIIYWFYFFVKSEMKFCKMSEYRFIKYLFIFILFESLFSGTIFWNIQFWSLLILSGTVFTVENKIYKISIKKY